MGKTYKAYVKQKEKQQRSEDRKKNGGPFMRSLASLAGAAVIVYSVCSFVATQADIAEKKKKLSQLEEKAAQLEAENDEYASILAEDDERAYMEKIAIEVLGFAYPNERRFYDTTRN
ncbi:MAG: hypothetical protein MRZ39_00450 [Oscillospiraceae bacterium]|nr:hypothetical protein [Oscillospiraceae bacterium]